MELNIKLPSNEVILANIISNKNMVLFIKITVYIKIQEYGQFK